MKQSERIRTEKKKREIGTINNIVSSESIGNRRKRRTGEREREKEANRLVCCCCSYISSKQITIVYRMFICFFLELCIQRQSNQNKVDENNLMFPVHHVRSLSISWLLQDKCRSEEKNLVILNVSLDDDDDDLSSLREETENFLSCFPTVLSS